METIFHQKPHDKAIMKHRIELIKKLSNELHNNILFRDTLNFNFLFHVYSSKLEEIYNNIDHLNDHEFKHRMQLLSQSIQQIKDYAIQ